jgi:hypothetical protein
MLFQIAWQRHRPMRQCVMGRISRRQAPRVHVRCATRGISLWHRHG